VKSLETGRREKRRCEGRGQICPMEEEGEEEGEEEEEEGWMDG
jgi:hypothetical protein